MTMTASTRAETGKGAVTRLRRSGRVPAIIYGSSEPVPLALNAHDFEIRLGQVSESTIVTLEFEGATHDVLIKDVQEDPVSGAVIHVDFYEIERGRTLRTNVPVHLEGRPIGVREGGILESLVRDVEVECLPRDLPESLSVDIDELDLGVALHVSDIVAPEGVRILTPGDQVVCLVAHRQAEEEVVEEEEGEELAEEEVETPDEEPEE